MSKYDELRRKYPEFYHPMYCDNGCGAVIEIAESFNSYKRGADGKHLLICECCAAEEGHRDEADETPETSPVCRRKPKVQLR